jgi:hypothetical protein
MNELPRLNGLISSFLFSSFLFSSFLFSSFLFFPSFMMQLNKTAKTHSARVAALTSQSILTCPQLTTEDMQTHGTFTRLLNKRQALNQESVEESSSLQSVIVCIQNALPARDLTKTFTLPLSTSEQLQLWETVINTWKQLKMKHAPSDEMTDTTTMSGCEESSSNNDRNNPPNELDAQVHEELTMDDWDDKSAEDDPLYCAQQRDAETIVDWARKVSCVSSVLPLSQMLSESDDDILNDRFCLIRVAITELETCHENTLITPNLRKEAEMVWRVVLNEWDNDASEAGITELIDMGFARWIDVTQSRFDPLYYIASTGCISRNVTPTNKRKLLTIARERAVDSGYYVVACKIFHMAVLNTNVELDKLLNHHRGCWLHIFNATFEDWRTIWTVVQREEDFQQLLQIASRTSQHINWMQLMCIDSLYATTTLDNLPRLGIAVHYCNNESVMKCMLEEMTSSCLDQAILDAPNLPTYIAQQVCPFFLQRGTTRPEVLARIVVWVETYAETHLSIDARRAFAVLQFTSQQREKIDKLRHFMKHADSCLVCMEDTLDRTACGHTIHVASCLVKLESAVCPGCRVALVTGGHVEEQHLKQLRTHIATSKAHRLAAWQNEMLRLQELYDDMLPPDVLHELAVRHNI